MNEKFIRLLDRFSQRESYITQLGMNTIEYIYDRDKDIIDKIINEYYIPF